MALLPVNNVYDTINEVTSSLYNVFGDNMTFYKVLPFTNTSSHPISHSWTALNMYNETSYNLANTSITYGGLLQSSLEGVPKAFWEHGMIVASFDSSTYREKFNGYNFGIYIPLDSTYTGMTSGLTATTLYSSFMWKNNALDIDPNNLCIGTMVDAQTCETNVPFTNNVGIGFPYLKGMNPMQSTENFYSGIAYLFTDNIYNTFTGATGSSTSWSYQFGVDKKFAKGARLAYPSLAHTENGTYDVAVGMVNLTAGLVYIWDKNLVEGFNWSGFTGDILTGATTTSGNTYAVVQDMDTEVIANIEIIATPGQWNNTSNPSIIGENCDTAFTNICLYDGSGNLLAVATPNQAIPLTADDYNIIKLSATISGAIIADTEGPWGGGLTTGYELGA